MLAFLTSPVLTSRVRGWAFLHRNTSQLWEAINFLILMKNHELLSKLNLYMLQLSFKLYDLARTRVFLFNGYSISAAKSSTALVVFTCTISLVSVHRSWTNRAVDHSYPLKNSLLVYNYSAISSAIQQRLLHTALSSHRGPVLWNSMIARDASIARTKNVKNIHHLFYYSTFS